MAYFITRRSAGPASPPPRAPLEAQYRGSSMGDIKFLSQEAARATTLPALRKRARRWIGSSSVERLCNLPSTAACDVSPQMLIISSTMRGRPAANFVEQEALAVAAALLSGENEHLLLTPPLRLPAAANLTRRIGNAERLLRSAPVAPTAASSRIIQHRQVRGNGLPCCGTKPTRRSRLRVQPEDSPEISVAKSHRPHAPRRFHKITAELIFQLRWGRRSPVTAIMPERSLTRPPAQSSVLNNSPAGSGLFRAQLGGGGCYNVPRSSPGLERTLRGGSIEQHTAETKRSALPFTMAATRSTLWSSPAQSVRDLFHGVAHAGRRPACPEYPEATIEEG